MEFPALESQLERVAARYADHYGRPESALRFIVAPYRICPLGGHVDHQGGKVLGRTINAYSLLAFTPTRETTIELISLDYPGQISIDYGDEPETDLQSWGRYACGAVYALRQKYPLQFGFKGAVSGTLPGGGLSSSASVGLAYLHAIAVVNELGPSAWNFVEFDRVLETEFLGLSNGILDQSMILFSEPHHLCFLDTRTKQLTQVPDHEDASGFHFLIAYSGFKRELTSTDFNTRVAECRQTAWRTGQGAARRDIIGYPVGSFQ